MKSVPAVLFYGANWVRVTHPGQSALGMYEHFWSLSVEEQFYFIWPLILVGTAAATKNVRNVAWVALALCALSAVDRQFEPFGDSGASVTNALQTNVDFLLFGATGAVLAATASAAQVTATAAKLKAFSYPAAAVLLAGVVFVQMDVQETRILRVFCTVLGICSAVVVLAVALNANFLLARFLSLPPLVYLGERSYAFYLWHYPILVYLHSKSYPHQRLLNPVVGFAVSVPLAAASYRLVERPILTLKDRRFGSVIPAQGVVR